MTYDQLVDQGIEQDRRERLKTAEAQILEQIADQQAEEMARGERCTECGVDFVRAIGRPARCTDCGGDGSASPLHVTGRYFACEADAAFWRNHRRQQRARYLRRVARYFGGGR